MQITLSKKTEAHRKISNGLKKNFHRTKYRKYEKKGLHIFCIVFRAAVENRSVCVFKCVWHKWIVVLVDFILLLLLRAHIFIACPIELSERRQRRLRPRQKRRRQQQRQLKLREKKSKNKIKYYEIPNSKDSKFVLIDFFSGKKGVQSERSHHLNSVTRRLK